MDINQAIIEANRCLLCHDAPCSRACPCGTEPATFIKKLRFKNITGAIRTIKQNNILGGVCGLLCPTARLCESGCCAKGLDRPIRIGEIQAALIEHSWNIGFKVFEKPAVIGKKVAVIGSGPAGLSCAATLARDGYRVTIFEEKQEPGGVLRYGVPEYRLPLKFLERELEDLKTLGVEIKCSTPVKGKGSIDELLASGFESIFLATGLLRHVSLKKDDTKINGLNSSVAFLESLRVNGETKELLKGKKVAVIGGGSVAIDCAESAIKYGASDVYLIYRRSYLQMPAEEEERIRAQTLGVHFLLLNRPVDYVTEDGRLRGIRLIKTRLGREDASGRRTPENILSSEWVLDVDICIEAIGNKAPREFPKWYPMIRITKEGLVEVDQTTCKTSFKGIFAGGDIVRGPALVVNAVADGKTAAAAMGGLASPRSGRVCPDLSVNFCGVKFQNPFMLSSSPVANTGEMVGRAFDAGWAGVAFKTIATGGTKIIHPSPRMHGYHYDGKRLVGLQNVEQTSDRSLKDNLRDITYLKKGWPKHIVMASIMGFSSREWSDLARAATDAGADMLELNFSCPHMTVEGSGYKVGQTFKLIQRFTEDVKRVTRIPVVAKMTPNITDMNEPAMYAKKGGADGISAINTIRGISEIGLDDLVPRPNVSGKGAISGYSGPAVKPVGLRFIAEMAQNKELGLPLSGMGGIETWVDALEYILVGATTVQVTTGVIHYGYRLIEDLVEGLSDYMVGREIRQASYLIGRALPNLHDTSAFDLTKKGRVEYDLKRCIGCGQCHIVCRDAGGQALSWNEKTRRPEMTEDKCLTCMICNFVCPVEGMITYKC